MTGMPTAEEVRSHMRFSSEERVLNLSGRVRSGELVVVRRGAHLEGDYLGQFTLRWEFSEVVGLARAIAVLHDGWAAATGVTAAMLHGIPRLREGGDVHVWSPQRSGGQNPVLPPVVLPGTASVGPCRVVRHGGGSGDVAPVEREGIRVLPLDVVVLSCCSTMPAPEAFVVACGALRSMSGYDKHRDVGGRLAEEAVRAGMLERISDLPSRARCRQVAREIVTAADAGCESVAEALLLWILRSHGVDAVVTQHRVTDGRHVFFIDLCIPGLMLAIEFDGRAKYGDDRNSVLDSFDHRDDRQKVLERMGYTVVRFRWNELADPEAVIAEIRTRLAHAGRDLVRGRGFSSACR